MANHPIRMSLLKQIITLKTKGYSHRQISSQLSCSRKTVNKYVAMWQSAGSPPADTPSFQSLLTKPIEEVIPDRLTSLYSLFPSVEKELKKTGVTRQMLWQDYRERAVGPALSYGRFCFHFSRWQQMQAIPMHLEHKAGDKLMVDFTGKKLHLVDAATGEEQAVEVFVAILAASQYTYVEAIPNQTASSFLTALENAFHFFGGVPRAVVPDNLKAAVTKVDRYEPVLNRTLEELAQHYGTVILPTRPYKPKDKALVEGAVKIIYTRLFAPLRHQVFTRLADLNAALRSLLQTHNTLPFTGRDYSRKEQFESMEQRLLSPLPYRRYEYKQMAKAKVYKSSFVWLKADKHYYSVPFRYIGKQVRLFFTNTRVEIYHREQRIASHTRQKGLYGYTAVTDHLPSTHNFKSDWNPEKFLVQAQAIGPFTHQLVEGVLKSKPHPEQGYLTTRGILQLARTAGKQRLEQACERALYFDTYSYRKVKNILDKGLEALQEKPREPAHPTYTIEHQNLRGKDYYQ